MISIITPSIRPEGLEWTRNALLQQTYKDFEWLVDINYTGKPDLNTADNRLIKRARGEYIVFLQDYIHIPRDGLAVFHEKLVQSDGRTVFTAPVGKIFGDNDTRWDWRTEREECAWNEWEIDWAAAPKDLIYEVGGFDESLDKHGWGFDNVNIGLRLDMADVKIECIPTNKAIAFNHDDVIFHPFRELINVEYQNRRLDEIRQGLKVAYI